MIHRCQVKMANGSRRLKAESKELSELLDTVKLSDTHSAEGVGPSGLEKSSSNLCCICQELCVNPVQLPCSHVFCYLCIKGVAARNNHCALCRHRINPEALSNPSIVNRGEIQTSIERSGDFHRWHYEAKNGGWWLYEERTSSEIEKAFKDHEKKARLQISGFYYIIDFENMIQYREDFPSRRRRIKRDQVNTETVKGVAGITVKEASKEQPATSDASVDKGSHAETESSPQTKPITRLVTGLD